MSVAGATFVGRSGVPVFVERDASLPLVDVEVVLRRGSVLDPEGLEGLTRLTAQLMRRGPRGIASDSFDERLDALGSSLSVGVGTEATRFSGSVLARHLPAFLSLLGRMITRPALRRDDFARTRRRAEADVSGLRDRDRALAARAYRRTLFRAHPYGRPIWGNESSLGRVTLDDVKAQQARLVRAPHVLLGFAGDVDPARLAALVDDAFGALSGEAVPRPRVRAPRARAGRHVVLVDKPALTQTKAYVGTLGLPVRDPAFTAAAVANTGFGVTFTSRLVREIRSERGWSYSVHSQLGADREREAWTMSTHPSTDQLLDCLRLQLELVERWVEHGLDAEELERARRYLLKGHVFDRETAAQRLDARLDALALGLPADWPDGFEERVSSVTQMAAGAAIRRFLDPRALIIALTATRTDSLVAGLEALPEVRGVEVIPFTEL